MGWFESPKYMRDMQKIAAANPRSKATNRVLIENLHGMYADADMRKQLSAMRDASQDKANTERMSIAKDRSALRNELAEGRYDINKDIYDFQKDQRDDAETLGWVNIGASGLRGYADMQHKKKLAKEYGGLATLFGG